MTASVDLTNLRSMTDGDAEMEKALFEEFYSSFEAGLQTLQAHMSENNEVWRKEAHTLKGIALNLGAEPLGKLCKQAQEQQVANLETKQTLMNKISLEYEEVKSFLQKLY